MHESLLYPIATYKQFWTFDHYAAVLYFPMSLLLPSKNLYLLKGFQQKPKKKR